jgi:hypothetical protein
VKEYLRYLKKKQFRIQRENFADRAANSIADGYSSHTEFMQLANAFYSSTPRSGFRDRLSFLLCHFGLMRGQDVRGLELADLIVLDLPNEGPSPCTALVMMLFQGTWTLYMHSTLTFLGKTNQFNNREYAACVRTKDVEICPISALAMYFFYRFTMEPGSSLPDYSDRTRWFNIKVSAKTQGASVEC